MPDRKNTCIERGCRKLTTTCDDCDRVVTSKKFPPDFTKEELKEILECLESCRVEYGGSAILHDAIDKVEQALNDH